MTPFIRLRAETVEGLLSEQAHGDPDIEADVRHFVQLVEQSPRLRMMIQVWADVAKDSRRNFDLFCVALWIGWQCHCAMDENEKLERMLK